MEQTLPVKNLTFFYLVFKMTESFATKNMVLKVAAL